jgi:hypothetical protein
MIEKPDQRQLSVGLRVEPQFDGFVVLAEFGQAQIVEVVVSAPFPASGKVRPVMRVLDVRCAWAEIGCELVGRRQRSPAETKNKTHHEIGEFRVGKFAGRLVGQDQRLHHTHPQLTTKRLTNKNGRCERRQLNVRSARLSRSRP